jgi:hypothetical protein
MVDKLTDPGRTTSPGNEPKWLVSGIARCHCGELVYTRSSGGRPSYVCRGPQQHLRRTAQATDDLVGLWVCAYLDRADNRDLLRPPARPGIDAPALRTEAAQLRERKAAQMRMHAAGDLDDTDLAGGLKEIRRRLAVIGGQLAAGTAPDPLGEFRDAPSAHEVWNGNEAAGRKALPLARKRGIVARLVTVTLLPAARRGRGLDPDSVLVEPRTP